MQDDLISQYKAATVAHGEGTCSGDSHITNQAHDAIGTFLREIISSGKDDDLFTLYDDKDPWVQLWSATHTLEVNENKATAKLQSLADAGIPIVSMTARYTLQEWQSGSLSFRG